MLKPHNIFEPIKEKIVKNNKKLAFVKTYGCQQNLADSEKIKGILAQIGYVFTEDKTQANLIVFNTCAVREHAEDRVFGNIGELKKLKINDPSKIIIICGCMSAQRHVAQRIKANFGFVDLVFGTNYLEILAEKLLSISSNSSKSPKIGEDLHMNFGTVRDNKIKAWLPIMSGCDNFCAYCIVPYVRGRETSREPSEILDEAKKLIESGYKEITLLGQNVNSYGKNLEKTVNFAELLGEIDEIKGDFRIRFMTSHPKDVTKNLIDTIAKSKHICHNLHLPFQSGSNRILSLMNRKYTRENYLEIVRYAKTKMPDLCLSSDVIVGFPSETRKDFDETLSLIEEVKFMTLFTFIYSKRSGTRAEKMADETPYSEKSARLTELIKKQNEIATKLLKSEIGKVQRVLTEYKNQKNGKLVGRNDGNVKVEIDTPNELIGEFADVKIIGNTNKNLIGKLKN